MKLLLKLSAIFIVVFSLGLGAVASLFHDSLQSNARTEVLDRAGMINDSFWLGTGPLRGKAPGRYPR